MTNDAAGKKKSHRRLWVAVAAIFFFLLVLVVPPLISVSHYKSQITRLMAQSLGRPVRLSSVEVRLLPWPGFVLTDLSVAEDPAYGVEPVLHANKVRASLRLLALWRGRLEIDKISLDEASLNLVRAAPGRWNLDPIFRTAAGETGSAMNLSGGSTGDANSRRAMRLPSLEATGSRINFKNGAEKLPFSLVNADISFWQASPGEWRIRLRGQPARTDVSLYQEETGVVRMEATVRSAPALSEMPLHISPELARGATRPASPPCDRLGLRMARRLDWRAARRRHRRCGADFHASARHGRTPCGVRSGHATRFRRQLRFPLSLQPSQL